MAEKLVTVIMGQNCDRFIEMCYESVKDSDAIVFCDGGSSDETIDYLKSRGFEWTPEAKGNKTLIFQNYNQVDREMNGKQRNFYLDYIKKTYPDYWCLCIDADEVVEDLSKIKSFIQNDSETKTWSIHMRHLIGDLAHEDSTQQIHFVPHRLFKISKAKNYPKTEHPVLQTKDKVVGYFNGTTIWHLAYIPNLWEIKKRYESHLLKSEMHTPQYLKDWYFQHLFGTYPKKQFNPVELPNVILKNFGIDKDELYFAGRGLETKHFIDALHWKEFFKCKNVIEFGCGRGPRLFAMESVGLKPYGVELSKYAVKNTIHPKTKQGSILNYNEAIGDFDLTIAYDVLEHIDYNDLDKAINTLRAFSRKYILVSIPYKGTPNCDNDPTHIIKEDRNWWVSKFTDKGLKEVEVPAHFLYKEQLLIFEK